MTNVATEITNMQSQTAIYSQAQSSRKASTENDSNMFLTLMLKQLENQDPTEPTDNTQWLSQLAQYSSLEQMTEMNSGLKDCMSYIAALYGDMTANSEITQTLSMIGKDVTIHIPDEKDSSKHTTIKGIVTEASFEDGTGKIKVGDKYYSIANVVAIREADGTTTETTATEPDQTNNTNS